jgi:hypothetical protein
MPEFSYFLTLASLATEDQDKVEFWLSVISGFLFFLVCALLLLAVAIRHIAKRSTRPCNWCMEFISKQETVCPRCGKAVAPAAVAPVAPKGGGDK